MGASVLEDLSRAHCAAAVRGSRREALLGVRQAGSGDRAAAGLERRPGASVRHVLAANSRRSRAGAGSRALFGDVVGEAQPILHAAESSAQLAGDDLLHDDVWAGNVCYTGGAILIDWASAQVGRSRSTDLPTRCYRFARRGAVPPPVEFADEPAYAALLAGSCAFQAAQPVNESIKRVSVTRRVASRPQISHSVGVWSTGNTAPAEVKPLEMQPLPTWRERLWEGSRRPPRPGSHRTSGALMEAGNRTPRPRPHRAERLRA